jgi:hypothetical protein
MKSERERPEIMWREIQEMSSGPMGLWGLEAVEFGFSSYQLAWRNSGVR